MEHPGLVLLGVVAIGVLYVLLPVAGMTWAAHRLPRALACPETGTPARVVPDAWRAALTVLVGRPRPGVLDCSLWPGRRGCGQGCLSPARA